MFYDYYISIFDIQSSQTTHQIDVKDLKCFEFNYIDTKLLIHTMKGELLFYDFNAVGSGAKKTTSLRTTGNVVVFKWYPFTASDFAYANHKNEIVFQSVSTVTASSSTNNKASTVKVQLPHDNGSVVTAIEWYDVDENYKYLLVGMSGSKMYLVDLNENNLCVVNTFEKYGNGNVIGLIWLSYEPGSFIMVNQNNTRYVKYNVSKCTYNAMCNLNMFHVYQIIKFNYECVLFTNIYGDVIVYNIKLNKIVFSITQSHCQTIFDLKINKHIPTIFATCSYDSTIRLWNTSLNKAYEIYYLSTLSTQLDSSTSSSSTPKPHVLCICWSYNESNLLCSGDTSQTLRVWDTSKHKQVVSFKLINNSKDSGLTVIHGIDWDKDDNIVCGCYCGLYLFKYGHRGNNNNNSSSSSGGGGVPTLTNTLIINVGHGIYKVIFNRIDSSFNTAIAPCKDGVIRIYNLKFSDSTPFQELKGHKHEVYAVALHKTKKILASSSNDFRIGIWDMKITDQEIKAKFLLGHTDNVRQIIWLEKSNHSILISGSWDSSIRCWNVDQMICIGIITEHQSDVYGIDISPQCGYMLISTSRDNTIRFWNYMKGCALAKLIAFDTNNSDNKVKQGMLIVKEYFYEEYVDKLFNVLAYYNNDSDGEHSWSVFIKEYVDYVNELVNENAQRKEKNNKYDYTVKKETIIEMLIQKAQKCGQWKLYCELCIELNKWEDAIMASPHVSKEYWKYITYKYSCYCNSNNTSTSNEKLFASLVSDDMEHAMTYLLSREEYEDAKLIWLTRHKCVHNNTYNDNNTITSNNSSNVSFTPLDDDKHILINLIHKHSIHCLINSKPLLACTSWLMLHDSFNAIKTCIQSIQYEIAFILMRITNNNIFNSEIINGLFTIRRNSPLKALIDLVSLSTDPYNTMILLSKLNRSNEIQNTNESDSSDITLTQAFIKKDCECLMKILNELMINIVNDIVNNGLVNENEYLKTITVLMLLKGIDVYASCTNYNDIICDILYVVLLIESIHDNYKSVVCLMKELLSNKTFIKGGNTNTSNSNDTTSSKAIILSIVNNYITKCKTANTNDVVSEYTLTENETASMNIKLANTNTNCTNVDIYTITTQLCNSNNDLCKKYICDTSMKYYYHINSEYFPHNLSSISLQPSSFSMHILKPKHHIKLHSKRLCTISEYFELTKFTKL